MVEAELPIDCKPLDPLEWQEEIDEQSGKYGKAYVRTGNPEYQNILKYLSELNRVYSDRPKCCIPYMNPSGELGILKCETEDEAKLAIEKLNAVLKSYN